VKHFTSPEFWELFDSLSDEIQERARRSFELLKANPRHPSLRFKKVGPYWSVRVGRSYRALGIDAEDGILWGWIGAHADYDRLLP
jgi:hypothetical protein